MKDIYLKRYDNKVTALKMAKNEARTAEARSKSERYEKLYRDFDGKERRRNAIRLAKSKN